MSGRGPRGWTWRSGRRSAPSGVDQKLWIDAAVAPSLVFHSALAEAEGSGSASVQSRRLPPRSRAIRRPVRSMTIDRLHGAWRGGKPVASFSVIGWALPAPLGRLQSRIRRASRGGFRVVRPFVRFGGEPAALGVGHDRSPELLDQAWRRRREPFEDHRPSGRLGILEVEQGRVVVAHKAEPAPIDAGRQRPRETALGREGGRPGGRVVGIQVVEPRWH